MKVKDGFSLIFTGILVICAAAITIFVARRELSSKEPELKANIAEDWEKIEFRGQQSGRTSAPVRIVKSPDYQCVQNVKTLF